MLLDRRHSETVAPKPPSPMGDGGGVAQAKSAVTRRQLRRVERAGEVVEFPLRTILLVAVALLQLAGKLVLLSRQGGKIIVRQLPPFFLHLAGELLPVPLDPIPVHRSPSSIGCEAPTPAEKPTFA